MSNITFISQSAFLCKNSEFPLLSYLLVSALFCNILLATLEIPHICIHNCSEKYPSADVCKLDFYHEKELSDETWTWRARKVVILINVRKSAQKGHTTQCRLQTNKGSFSAEIFRRKSTLCHDMMYGCWGKFSILVEMSFRFFIGWEKFVSFVNSIWGNGALLPSWEPELILCLLFVYTYFVSRA